MTLNILAPFPVEVDPDVEETAIEENSSSLLVVTLRFTRQLSEQEYAGLRSLLNNWQAKYVGYLVDLDLDEGKSVFWNSSHTTMVLRGVWDFETGEPKIVITKFFSLVAELPIKSARLDSIFSDPAEDLE